MGVPVNLHGLRVSAGQVALPGNLNQGLDIPFDLKGPRQVSRDVQPGRHDGSSFRGPGPPGRQVSPVGIEEQAREARGIGLLGGLFIGVFWFSPTNALSEGDARAACPI